MLQLGNCNLVTQVKNVIYTMYYNYHNLLINDLEMGKNVLKVTWQMAWKCVQVYTA